jgi:hypothetical protein
VRKLFWILFRFDLQDHWNILVQGSDADLGGNGTWRVREVPHSGRLASLFLDAMVKVRHGFAQQDPNQPKAVAGMAISGAGDRVAVQSHHAYNAISGTLQLSILSTQAVIDHLCIGGPAPHWGTSLNNIDRTNIGIEYWLSGSPAEEAIRNSWRGSYPSASPVPAGSAPITQLGAAATNLSNLAAIAPTPNANIP